MTGKANVISGVVRGPSGKPVPDARVSFTNGPVPLPDTAALTDDNGSFSLSAPSPGAYTIEVNADGFAPKSVTVKIPGGEKTDLDIRLKK
jgi:uncharacterized GH25 family protein